MPNKQEVSEITEKSCIFKMLDCRVQSARNRKGLADFPCKKVSLIEYEVFGKTIDSRIKMECLWCPPDEHPKDSYCAWKFTID